MKKLVLILLAFAFIGTMSAQKMNDGYITLGGEAGDTVTASASKLYSVYLKDAVQFDYSVQVSTDSISGTPGYTALLQYSNSGDDWFNLDTVTTSTGVDTSFVFTGTNNVYKNLRVKLTGSATAQKSKAYIYWMFTK